MMADDYPKIPTGELITSDPYAALRQFTRARIALGRTGTAIPHRESLAFKLAHAAARDAVYSRLDTDGLHERLTPLGLPVMHLKSRAATRDQYLQRPDFGRALESGSGTQLTEFANPACDLCIILADGLSSAAINTHAPPLLEILVPQFKHAGFTLAPLTIAEQARVAISDPIGHLLNARLSLILIGERPGLSSPQSMGAYLTYQPAPGLTDEARNCISNIHPEGLTYQQASARILYLVTESLRRKLSGIALKDETGTIE